MSWMAVATQPAHAETGKKPSCIRSIRAAKNATFATSLASAYRNIDVSYIYVYDRSPAKIGI
jgi:hypothetical protein